MAGDSEAGKSSIMYAIAWALYGGQATKNVNTLGHKGAEVTFEGFGLTATRAKNPERFTCGGLADEAAQKHVESALNMSWDQFKASSFVEQKLKGSLLSLAPAEQLKFVQKLAYGDDDPELYRAKIYSFMKTQEESLGKIEAAIAALVAQKESLELTLATTPIIRPEAQGEALCLKTKVSGLNDQLDLLKAEARQLQTKLSTLNSELSHPGRLLGSQIENINTQLSKLNIELVDAMGQTPPVLPTHASMIEVQRRLELCAKQKMWLSQETTLKNVAATIIVLEEGTPVSVIEQEMAKREKSIAEKLQWFVTEADLVKEEIRKAKESLDVLECPACKTALRRSADGRLVHATDATTNAKEVIAGLTRRLSSIENDAGNTAKDLKEVTNVLRAAMSLGAAPLPAATTVERVQTAVDKLNATLAAYNSASVIAQNQKKEVQRVESVIKTLETQLAKLNASKVELRIEDEVRTDIDRTQRCQKQNQDLTDTITAERDAANTRFQDLQREIASYAKRTALEEQLQSLMRSIEQKEAERAGIQEEYTAGVRLKNLSDLAATEAVAGILDAINTNARTYTDQLFPDCGTSIRLLNEKVNKTDGKSVAKFSLAIEHKGIKYDSLDEFSGGAENRAMLAFQLAISDLYNSPVLLLDEPLTGVHESLRNDILAMLQEVGQRKLVLVIEHGACDSAFSDIINVK